MLWHRLYDFGHRLEAIRNFILVILHLHDIKKTVFSYNRRFEMMYPNIGSFICQNIPFNHEDSLHEWMFCQYARLAK